jgi:hypothetical protein
VLFVGNGVSRRQERTHDRATGSSLWLFGFSDFSQVEYLLRFAMLWPNHCALIAWQPSSSKTAILSLEKTEKPKSQRSGATRRGASTVAGFAIFGRRFRGC